MITVVVPAWRAWRTLPAVMEALRPQVVDSADRELVLVESSGGAEAGQLEHRWPWARVITPGGRVLPGAARNIAVAHARGDVLAFIDADAVPEPDWLDELERGLVPDADAVAGAVVNGTPRSAVGTGAYVLEFAEWHPHRHGLPRHAATCNLLIRRNALEQAGGFPEGLWPGEDTVVTWPIAQRGRLAFAPAARVRHVNRTDFADFLWHQVRLGWSFAEVCGRVRTTEAMWARLPLAPLSGIVRIPKLLRHLYASRTHGPVWPIVSLGSCAWGAGLTAAAFRRAAVRGN